MRVLVLGTGGVGGYFGGRLARAGIDVTFVARGAHLEALRARGLGVRSTLDGEWRVPVRAVADAGGSGPADLVIVAVKGQDTNSALGEARGAVGPRTAVLSLQNGVEALERIEAVYGPGHGLGGVAYVFAALESPGNVVHRAAGRIVLGEPGGGSSARADAVAALLVGAGVPATVSERIQVDLWEKYVFICAQAGMTAVVRAPIDVIRACGATWAMYRAVLEEITRVAAAAGVGLDAGVVERLVAAASALPPGTSSSLCHDLLAGRRLELETLHGHAVRLAARYAVAAPAVGAVYAALLPHIDGIGR